MKKNSATFEIRVALLQSCLLKSDFNFHTNAEPCPQYNITFVINKKTSF